MKRIETLFILAMLCSLFSFSGTKANKYIAAQLLNPVATILNWDFGYGEIQIDKVTTDKS